LTGELTAASVWESMAGTSISENFLEWPADLFALTNVILERSEAYRFVFSPVNGLHWPPLRFANWSEAGGAAGRQWTMVVEDRNNTFPDLLSEEWKVFRGLRSYLWNILLKVTIRGCARHCSRFMQLQMKPAQDWVRLLTCRT